MGNSCSCLLFRRDGLRLVEPNRREATWFPIQPGAENNTPSEDTPTDVVVEEQGRLHKKKLVLPHGAAANLSSLICQAYDLAQMTIHSKACSYYLVRKLISIQDAILDDRLLLVDGVLMLKAQELALEVGQMIKLFSCRGWLARLNRPDVDDETEFKRLCNRLNLLREHCGLDVVPDSKEVEENVPTSGALVKIIKHYGSLQNQVNKNEEQQKSFVRRLLPFLSVDEDFASDAVGEEIRIAAAAELPAAHTVIRHPDLRYLWWTYLESEEATWEDFWKFFPDALDDLEKVSEGIGDLASIRGLLQSPASRRQFKSSINSSRNSEYVLSVELDNAFAPNRTIEESLAILLSPMDGSQANVQYMERFLKPAITHSLQRAVRDEAGIAGEHADIVGREEEIGRVCSSIEAGNAVVMITGMPGVGKTAVAATAADELVKSLILKRVYYLNLSNVTELTDAIFRIGAALKHPIYQSALTSEERLKNWLRRHGNKDQRTGWILDGLDRLFLNPDARHGLFSLLSEIMDFFPVLHVLLTCSELPEDIEKYGLINEVVRLGPLPDADAFHMAESLLGRALSKGEARQLVTATEGFPLGIKIGGSGILAGGCSASRLEQRLQMIRDGDDAEMRAAWNRAHDMIREGMNSLVPEDRNGLILLSQCPDNFTVEHAAAVLGQLQKPTQTWSLLWRLMMRGFVRYIPIDGTYRLEEAVSDVIAHCTVIRNWDNDEGSFASARTALEMDEDQRDSSRAGLVIYYLRLLDRALVVFRSGFHLSTYRLLEQERDGLERFVRYLSEAAVRKKLLSMGSKGKLLKLLKILNDFVVDVGKHYFTWRQVRSICESVGWLWEEDQSPFYDEVSYKLRLSLANALACIGERRDAETILNQLETYIDSLSSCTDRDLKAKADVLVLKAKIQHLVGRYPEAERYFVQGLHAQQGAYGSDHFTVSRTYSLLATVQQILQKHSDAEHSYKCSLKIRMKHSHKNVVEVPTVMHNWASLNHRLGKHEDAEKLYTKSLVLREKYLGHRSIEVASSLSSLAAVKVSLGHREEARQLYTRALSMLKDIVGEEHQAVAYTATRLGVLLEMQHCCDEAVVLFNDALRIDEKIYGRQNDLVQKSIERIQRAAIKHAQTLKTSKQFRRWKQHVEDLLERFHFKWPTVRDDKPIGMETSADLMATSHSLSTAIAQESSHPKTQEIKESMSSFQGFATSKADSVSDSDFETPVTVDQGKSPVPQLSHRHPFSADPPLQDAHKRTPSTGTASKAASSILGTGHTTSELNFGSHQEMTRTISHAYPLVHDNAQFRVVAGPSSSLESGTQDPYAAPSSPYMTFTLEDDLMETTHLVPEQYDAVQSLIRNPLYGREDRTSALPLCDTPEPLINTHASFEL